MRLRLFLTLVLAAAATFLVPAAAQAVPGDKWATVFVDKPSVTTWTVASTAKQWGSWKNSYPSLWADTMKVNTGRVFVRLPKVQSYPLQGVAHVTAVSATGNYCEVFRIFPSGGNQYVDVTCFRPGGALADTQFSLLWTLGSGVLAAGQGSQAYLERDISTVAQTYNSTGVANTLATVSTGVYRATFPGVAAGGLSGNVQVSAYHHLGAPRRCKLATWALTGAADITADIACFDQNGAPIAGEFVVSCHRERASYGLRGGVLPRSFGYLTTGGPFNTNYNYKAGGWGVNTVAVTSPGRYLVTYPQLGMGGETNVQVTATGPGSGYCSLAALWIHSGTTATADVKCFDNAGVATAQDFSATFDGKY
ncbi:hypothetical protein [Longispora albida]|uniref:hypothetical protein n=1 Tax=Longispora albida TaxID=203523 RepID=UPI00035F231A|nr:hypothetical protein [Longispora albida]